MIVAATPNANTAQGTGGARPAKTGAGRVISGKLAPRGPGDLTAYQRAGGGAVPAGITRFNGRRFWPSAGPGAGRREGHTAGRANRQHHVDAASLTKIRLLFKKKLAEAKDEATREVLRKLIAAEEAKPPPTPKCPVGVSLAKRCRLVSGWFDLSVGGHCLINLMRKTAQMQRQSIEQLVYCRVCG